MSDNFQQFYLAPETPLSIDDFFIAKENGLTLSKGFIKTSSGNILDDLGFKTSIINTEERIEINKKENNIKIFDNSGIEIFKLGSKDENFLLIQERQDRISIQIQNTIQLTVAELILCSVSNNLSVSNTITAQNEGSGSCFKANASGTGICFNGSNTGSGSSLSLSQPDLTNPIGVLFSTSATDAIQTMLKLYRVGGGGGVNSQGIQVMFMGRDNNFDDQEIGRLVFAFSNQQAGSIDTFSRVILNNKQLIEWTDNGNTAIGFIGATNTAATNGFLYIPSCAGTPTGTPTSISGKIPLIYDSTNNILYAYSNGAWRPH